MVNTYTYLPVDSSTVGPKSNPANNSMTTLVQIPGCLITYSPPKIRQKPEGQSVKYERSPMKECYLSACLALTMSQVVLLLVPRSNDMSYSARLLRLPRTLSVT